jgi:nucleotide-binding universal stress UspA family protein
MKNKATLLVTTDFSTNSKAAIRFALQLAKQMPCKLVFYHVLEFMTPLAWHEDRANAFTDLQIEKGTKELDGFLKGIYKQANMPADDYDYTVEVGMDVDERVIKHAQRIKADFICMSTRGAGVLKKFIGTNASALVNTSPIPVFVVPKNYRIKPITKVAYASDFENIQPELALVKDVAGLLNAPIDVYHFHYKVHETNAKVLFQEMVDKYQSKKVTIHVPPIFLEYSLIDNIQMMIKKEKPSILVMFTKEKRNWLERFFIESRTADMTFDIKIPLLAIRKNL